MALRPTYLTDLVAVCHPVRTLRSPEKNLCWYPGRATRDEVIRAFSANAPSLWNALPPALCSITEMSVFKIQLKTRLFMQAFNV